jgi:LPXTG-motif cell wall-anchored protein
METEHFGLGCSISIAKDFEGDPWNAAINLVHGPGWTPDHVFEVSSDDLVVWDELPSGDYTVSEFDGAVDGTTISIDGAAPSPHAGEPVAVTVGQSVLVTNPDVTLDLVNPTVPEDDPGEDPDDPDDSDDPDDPDDPGHSDDDPEPTDPESTPPSDLPTTGSSTTGLLVGLGLLSGLGGIGCTAIARRRR